MATVYATAITDYEYTVPDSIFKDEKDYQQTAGQYISKHNITPDFVDTDASFEIVAVDLDENK